MTFSGEKTLIRNTSGALQTSGIVQRCLGGCGTWGGQVQALHCSSDVKFPARVHANTKPYAKPGFNFVLLIFLGTQSCLLLLIC